MQDGKRGGERLSVKLSLKVLPFYIFPPVDSEGLLSLLSTEKIFI